MILPNAFSSNKRKPTKQKLIVDDQSDASSDGDKSDDDEEQLDDNEDESNSEGEQTDGVVRKPTIGDYETVTKGPFKGYYEIVTSNSYGGEVEIQYFPKQSRWCILRGNDLDSIDPSDLKQITLLTFIIFEVTFISFLQCIYICVLNTTLIPSHYCKFFLMGLQHVYLGSISLN